MEQKLSNFSRLLDDFYEALPLDDEGEIIYPEDGQEGFAFIPESAGQIEAKLMDALKTVRVVLVRFKHAQNSADRTWIQQNAVSGFQGVFGIFTIFNV